MKTYADRNEGIDSQRLLEIAKELAGYGLGISVPHMHSASGRMVSLPSGQVALEQQLHISFVDASKTPESAVPVGWRWNQERLEVWAFCCGDGDGDGDGKIEMISRPADSKVLTTIERER